MKKLNNNLPSILRGTALCLLTFWFSSWNIVMAQDSLVTEVVKPRPVTTFEGQFIVDNQTAVSYTHLTLPTNREV